MIRSRVRPCISLAGTCRNVTCVGSSVQVETCQCRALVVTWSDCHVSCYLCWQEHPGGDMSVQSTSGHVV
ncbi:hypothetical protein RRG08_066885 [Elysia crispata]|uniref:Uncharacterized protein n=1 Tax=Elysia crispata TaxID=231223 RepID=A0AAE0XX44_9GAST|nr:hypothetical protein RRG08_066885 [Elysia crispata]